jgi:predicted unusual protein kinase regulating ubiquinone biosynthesis (AarF/ABC1/UbiB family)
MQVLANRPDIVREDYMNELCALQDDVPAFPSKVQHSAFDSAAFDPSMRLIGCCSRALFAAGCLLSVDVHEVLEW